tara:strand:+ start:5854 stop:8217 length:2364 start_codon:yes stop_codon:yes gene_type:complete
MPVPGLNPNIRLAPELEEENNLDDLVIVNADEGGADTELDEAGNVLRIQHANGDITVSIDGGPVSSAGDDDDEPEGWYDNLAKEIEDLELSRISDELLRGIEADISTRSDWIEDRAQGLKLLGLKIELPGVQGSSDGAPVEGMSKVRHPLLLEAVLRFQANARSELLPTDGPVKIRDDSNNSGAELDKLASALEKDMNHYLTVTATEYYPDTDRMLFMVGFGGDGFKKVYFCPLRNRPVSESIDAEDLIVNNSATDLENSRRITHRIMMKPSVVKRMQIIGAYRDIPLSEPGAPSLNAAQEERNAQQGVSNTVMNHEDRDREIYECYCELDIKGFEHLWKKKPSGLEVPYRVTVDVSSRQILSIVRNYEEGEELPTARKVFVKYPFVPGLGFYDIGLLHILGNTTNAVTAAWRELLDAGMFAAFPGFLMADQGARQNTNIFRVPPGGSATVKTNGMKISDAIMPLPYKEPSPALMTLAQNIAEYGQRVGGTSELAVGEGRQDAPVGTTLAIIDQATKVLNSVHKRLHSAQAEEFQLLKKCFSDNPESFWQRNKSPAYPWDEQTFRQALDNYYLIPQADPNTASHTQRMMKTMALIQLAQTAPDMYDLKAVNRQALRTIGYNPDEFVKKDSGEMSPQAMASAIGLEATKSKMANETMKTQSDAALKAAQAQKTMSEIGATKEGTNPADMINAQAAMMSAENDRADLHLKSKELDVDEKDITMDGQNRAQERDSREKLAMVNLQRDAMKMDHEKAMQGSDMQKIALQAATKPQPAPKAPGKKPKPGLIG